MKTYHICYHTDEDGLASAAVIYEYLKRVCKKYNTKFEYSFYKIDYTVNLKDVLPKHILSNNDEIYFVDYSFSNENNLEYILELSIKGIEVIWIDHHKTSLDILHNDKYRDISDKYKHFHYFINTAYCGAYLAYAYAYFKLKGYTDRLINFTHFPEYIPLYIKYVDSWDTWKHDMPNTIEFNTGARIIKRTPRDLFSLMLNFDSNIINKLFSDKPEDNELIENRMQKYIDDIISKGSIIKTYDDINNESICENYGFKFNIIDETGHIYYCFAVNKRGNSTIFGDKVNKYDVVVPFQFNGKQYVYSLYTTKSDVNCEALAKKLGSIDGLGGGGHIKAAGFQTYTQILKGDCTIYIKNKLFSKNKYKIILK